MLGKGFRNTGTCDFLTVFVFAPPPLLLWLVGEINKTGGGWRWVQWRCSLGTERTSKQGPTNAFLRHLRVDSRRARACFCANRWDPFGRRLKAGRRQRKSDERKRATTSCHTRGAYLIVSYRMLSYRIVCYRIVSYVIVSYRIVSYLYRIVSYLIVSYRILSYLICIVSYLIVSSCYRIVSYRILFSPYFSRILSYLHIHIQSVVLGPMWMRLREREVKNRSIKSPHTYLQDTSLHHRQKRRKKRHKSIRRERERGPFFIGRRQSQWKKRVGGMLSSSFLIG